MSHDKETACLAVLIDADNAQPCMASLVLAEVAKFGTASVKRAYGDWTTPNLNGWKQYLLENSIQPIQQFAYTKGKNSTDAAMAIDAMDLLNSNCYDGFCLVSSDSDFTRLASRIREAGLCVYGCGQRHTPQPFVTACDKFIYVENLRPNDDVIQCSKTSSSDAESHRESPDQAAELLKATIQEKSDLDGWAALCEVGDLVVKRNPDFDPRTYGKRKLSDLVAKMDEFEVKRTKKGVVYVRLGPK